MLKCCPKEEGALESPKKVALRNVAFGNVDEDEVDDDPNVDAYISKLHSTNLEKQHVAWGPYNRNLPTWVFFKVNNN
jgi:hypothetical protein